MHVYNLREAHFADHATRGRKYIRESRAKDFFNYNKNDRDGMREVFKQAVEIEWYDPNLVLLYFQNLCEDYKMDFVMADEVIAEYERLSPIFEKLTGEQAALVSQFDSAFGSSGVASCENLEAIYGPRIAADPKNEKLLATALLLPRSCSVSHTILRRYS